MDINTEKPEYAFDLEFNEISEDELRVTLDDIGVFWGDF